MDNPFVYSVSVLCGEERKVLAQGLFYFLVVCSKTYPGVCLIIDTHNDDDNNYYYYRLHL